MNVATFSRRLGTLVGAVILIVMGGAVYSASSFGAASNDLNLRLQWIIQAQFAGYVVADRLGYYRHEGLHIHIRPAGPDLKPLSTIAAGTDDIGIGVSNQVALARENGVPVKIIAQIFQDSANRYVLLQKNRISNLADLRGKKVGLWLGGDEAEFIAMLATVGMKLSDVQVIPQGFSVAPFLHGDYVLSEVTVYNELLQIENTIGGQSALQVLSPAHYNSAIVGDMIVVKEKTIRDRRDQLVRFLRASIRGWKYALKNREKAVDIVVAANPELKRDEQLAQLDAVAQLTMANTSIDDIGVMKPEAYATTVRILRQSGQMKADLPAHDLYDDTLWKAARQ